MMKFFPQMLGRLFLVMSLLLLASCGHAPPASPSEAPTVVEKPNQKVGTLALTILWPVSKEQLSPDAGPRTPAPVSLRTHAIPDSAATVTLTVKNSNNYIMGSTPVNRSPGQMSVSANVTVAIGSNYSVLAEAKDNSSTLIAQGSAAGVTVTENNTTNVSIVMAALNVPSITALNQANGGPGVSMTLTGTNFGYTRNTSLQVYFNATANADNTVTGTQATTVNRTSDTSITVTVPTGATSGNIIVRADGIPSVSTANFTVIQTLTISPTSATVATDNTQNFSVTATDTANQAITDPVVSWSSSDTSTATISGSGVLTAAAGGTTTVTVASGTITATASVNVTPVLTSVSPTSGPPGDSVTLTGKGFRSSQGTSTVAFNGTNASSISSWSNTSITATVPTGATNGNIVVTVNGQASNSLSFTSVPQIDILSITSGIVGDTVTLTGAAFGVSQGTSTVKFDGTTATVSSWSNTSILVTVPSVAAGSRPIVVTVGGVNSNSAAFTVKPNLTGLNPTSGPIGASVTLSGSNFGATQGTSTVTVGGINATASSWSDTSIGITIPSGVAAGANAVVVTVNGAASSSQTFTVRPDITSLSPASATTGTSVTITGTAFGATQGTSTVAFNGTNATVTSWSTTSIVATVPDATLTGNVVVAVAGQASNGVNFTVIPKITGLSPSSGLKSGDAVTIAGTGFGISQGTSTVKFNGVTASVTSWSNSSITCTVPSGVQTGNVVVRVDGNDSNGSSFTANGRLDVTVN